MASKIQRLVLEVVKELLWWVMSAVLAYAIMWPITSKVQYSQLIINGILLMVALNYFRYAVFLRSVYILRSKWVRFALGVFNINFFVYVLRRFQGFMSIYDSFTVEDLGRAYHPLAPEDVYPLFKYFYLEITLCVSATLVLTAALTLRLVLTYWSTARLRLNAGAEE